MKRVKQFGGAHKNDYCDGGGLMSRRAECAAAVCMQRNPEALAPMPIELKRKQAPCAVDPTVGECCDETSSVSAVMDPLPLQPLYPSLTPPAAVQPYQPAAAATASAGMAAPPAQQGAPQSFEDYHFNLAMRTVAWSYKFQLSSVRDAPQTLTCNLTNPAAKRLQKDQDLTIADVATAEVPPYVMPVEINIHSTRNTAVVPLVAIAKWIPAQGYVSAEGQVGAFQVPCGTWMYGGDACLYKASKFDTDAVMALKYLIGKNFADLSRAAKQADAATVSITQNSDLDNILAARMAGYQPGRLIPISAFNEEMNKINSDITFLNMLITRPDQMGISLELSAPPGSLWNKTSEQLVDEILGDIVADAPDVKTLNLTKLNLVNISLDMKYYVLGK